MKKEEIALQLTIKAIETDKIIGPNKFQSTSENNEIICKEFVKFYNYLLENLAESESCNKD